MAPPRRGSYRAVPAKTGSIVPAITVNFGGTHTGGPLLPKNGQTELYASDSDAVANSFAFLTPERNKISIALQVLANLVAGVFVLVYGLAESKYLQVGVAGGRDRAPPGVLG